MKGQSKIKNIIHIHTLEILKKYTGFSYKKTILEATTPRRFSCRTVPVSSAAHEKLQPIKRLLLSVNCGQGCISFLFEKLPKFCKILKHRGRVFLDLQRISKYCKICNAIFCRFGWTLLIR